MKIRFTFQGLGHTQAIEDHISKKLTKLDEYLTTEASPKNVDVHIKKDASIKVELVLTSKNYHLDAHCSDYDLYKAADDAVAKLITQIKKQRSKMLDKQRHDGADKRTIHESEEDEDDMDDMDDFDEDDDMDDDDDDDMDDDE